MLSIVVRILCSLNHANYRGDSEGAEKEGSVMDGWADGRMDRWVRWGEGGGVTKGYRE